MRSGVSRRSAAKRTSRRSSMTRWSLRRCSQAGAKSRWSAIAFAQSLHYSTNLLGSMGNGHFSEDQRVENRQHMLAVGQHAFQHAVIHGIAFGQALPALQDMRRDID